MVRAAWGSIAPYWRIARLLPGVSAPMTLALAAGVALGVLLPLAGTLATGALVGAVPAAISGGPDSPEARIAVVALAAVGSLFVLTRALGSVRSTLAHSLGRRLDEHLRERVMVALNRPSGVAHLEAPGVRDLIERALNVSGSRWRAGVTIEPLANAASGWLQGVGATLILARFDVALALAWFTVCSVAAHFLRREFLRSLQLFYSDASSLRRADYVRQLALSGGPAKEVRVWGLLGWLIDRYTQEALRVFAPAWDARSRGNRANGIAALAIGAVQIAVLAAVGSAGARGEITLRDLTVYVGATLTLGVLHVPRRDALPLAYGTATLPAVLELERLTADAAARETGGAQAPDDTPDGAPNGASFTGRVLPDETPRQGIRFERVSFCYPGEFRGPVHGTGGAGERTPEEGQPLGHDADPSASSGQAPSASSGQAPSASSGQAPSASSGQALSASPGQVVLRDLDLFIPAGRSLAIVGENGAGKTTLVKLLARLYDPTAGRITADGVDLREIAPRSWQRRVSAIFQDFVHFALPARDNVAFGAPEQAGNQPALVEAARKAGALEMIEGLPHGWETMLSRQYTGGTDLSGGQWQRLALARALFAVSGGARVLILDEPTANLDVRAEAALYERFLDITQGLTTIVISHRFSTVRRADHIVVLDGGCVVEDGTHDELLAAGGRYAHMFTLQAQRFAGGDARDDAEKESVHA